MRANKRQSGTLRSESGLTMLELIVAMAVLAIGIVGVLRAFSSGMTTVKTSERYSVAAIMAEQVASELERRTDIGEGELSGSFENDPDYTWEAQVQPADENDIQQALITVLWYEGNRERKYNLVVCLRPTSDEEPSEEMPEGPTEGAAPPTPEGGS